MDGFGGSSAMVAKAAGRYRDFGVWAEPLGEIFCSNTAQAYESFFSNNKSTESTYWQRLSSFINYAATSPSQEGLREFLLTGVIATSGTSRVEMLFHGWLSGYRETLLNDDSITLRTKANFVACISSLVCGHFADCGVVPQGLRIKKFNYIDEMAPSLLSVALNSENPSSSVVSELINTYVGDSDVDDKSELTVLVDNLLAEAKSVDSGDIVASSVAALEGRISLLKTHAAEAIVTRIKEFQAAAKWEADPAIRRRAASLKDVFDSPHSNAHAQGAEYETLLSDYPLETLVVFCRLHTSGVYPLQRGKYAGQIDSRIPQYLEGDYGIVRRHLGMSVLDIVHCASWLMLEHAINSSSAIKLKVDCLSTVGDGLHMLSWTKARMGGDNQLTDLTRERPDGVVLSADTLTSVDIIEFAQEAAKSYRPLSTDGANLFLHYYKCGPIPRTPSDNAANRVFQSVCEAASGGRWSTNLKSLRASVLILEGLVSRNPFAVQKKAGHKSLAMAKKYVYQIPEILRRDGNIREFLDWFEALLTVGIDDFADKVGIDAADYAKRKEMINRQFGGIHCEDPYAGVQPGTKRGELCTQVSSCVTCVKRRNIFLFTQDNIINVILWDRALNHGKSLLQEDEFQARWGVWKLFTSSILKGVELDPTHQMLYKRSLESSNGRPNPYEKIFSDQPIAEAIL